MKHTAVRYTHGDLPLFVAKSKMLKGAQVRPFDPRIVVRGQAHIKVAWCQPPMNSGLAEDLVVKPPNRPSLTGLALLSPLRHFWPATVDTHIHSPPWHHMFNDITLDLAGMKRILFELTPDLVCLTAMPYNHEALLELATLAKGWDATVIVGGHHATFAAELIMRSQGAIDAVCVHQGQEALVEIVGGLKFSEIPNLVWRDRNGEVHVNEIVHTPMSTILPDFPYIDYRLAYDDHHVATTDTVAPTHLQQGCHFRTFVPKFCEFCACSEPYTDSLTPEQAVRLLYQLRMRFGIKQVNDVSEDLTGNKPWFNAFCAEHRKRHSSEMPAFWQISSRGNISSRTADMLAGLGVHSIFIGAESGADEILKNMCKHITAKIYQRTFGILMERGIRPAIGIVAGCTGESSATLAQTRSFVEQFVEQFQRAFGELPYVEFSPLSPRMGAPVREKLMQDPSFRAKHSERAFPDGSAEARDATPILTNGLSFDYLCDWIRRTREDLGLNH